MRNQTVNNTSTPSGQAAHSTDGGSLEDDVLTLFSRDHYLRSLATHVPAGELDRLMAADTATVYGHWLGIGLPLGLDPHPLFSVQHYLEQAGATIAEIGDPLADYLKRGPNSGISPSPHFDAAWYLKFHGDVAAAAVDPLLHYLRHGMREGRSPSGVFNLSWYASYYPDAKRFPGGPLLHYILEGQAERRFRGPHDLAMAEHVAGHESHQPEFDISQSLGNSRAVPVGTQFEPSALPLVPLTSDVKLLSFDIWDTVLFRRCHPDAVKLASARLLFVDHRWRLRPAFRDILALYRQRRSAEDASSKTDDFEYRFDDALIQWLQVVLEPGTPSNIVQQIRRQMLEHEFEMESRASFISPAFLKFLKTAPADVPLVFASDFYMPSEFLSRLLARKGLRSGFAKVYASSDHFENKRSGRLYERIAADFAVAPGQVVHMGDNAKADVASAVSRGVRGYLYSCPVTESARHRQAAVFESLQDGSLTEWGQELRLLQARAAKDLVADDGAEPNRVAAQHAGLFLSPLVVGFLLHVIEKAKLFNVKKVYFLTREGIFFERAFKALVDANPFLTDYPETQLLEVSRVATFAPSLQAWSAKELMRLWSLYSTQSPKAFLRSLNFDDPWFEQAFRRGGLALDEPIRYPWLHERFVGIAFSAEFTQRAEKSIQEQRSLLAGYLAEQGFVSDKSPKLIVDIGWRGSIQDNLARLCSDHIHGCYFGLMKYLNEQPKNASKSAWLFDFNAAAPWRQELEVAPVEMLFNASGGSVRGYEKSSRGHRATRAIDPQEEAVFDRFTSHFQASVVNMVARLADYTALTAATSTTFVPLGRALLDRLLDEPPLAVAEAFISLSHNETFGTGDFYSGPTRKAIPELMQRLDGAELHHAVAELLKSARWSNSLRTLIRHDGTEGLSESKLRNVPSSLWSAGRAELSRRSAPPRIGFVVPAPIIGSGGHRTIFNIARKFIERGCEVYCYLESEGDGVAVVQDMLVNAKAHIFVGWQHSATLDVAFATIAHSAQFVASMPNVTLKTYLVQDLEAVFNPVGDAYTVAENSYALGLTHFTIGNWLSDIVRRQYAAVGIPAGLGVDTGVYRPLPDVVRGDSICFLYQPEKPRRNTRLLIDALRIVKRERPSIRLLGYGSNAQMPKLDFEVENLGLIRDLEKLNQLYNECKVGVCLSMSNPSRIPFELMASGAIPVDLYRYNNLFDYDDGTILLAYQSPSSLAAGILSMMDSSPEIEARRAACMKFARSRTSDWETDVIVNASLRALETRQAPGEKVAMRYTADAFVSPEDDSDGVRAFCDWQRHLAASE